MDDINPEKFALPYAVNLKGKIKNSPPKPRTGEKFLKGPIPWNWLLGAAKLPGKALHVAITIWFLAGIKRDETINLSLKILGDMGVKRNAAYRGLTALEEAGLVSVSRHRGRCPVVTINT
jgi:DNA-binding MarR family transcriptional regulator